MKKKTGWCFLKGLVSCIKTNGVAKLLLLPLFSSVWMYYGDPFILTEDLCINSGHVLSTTRVSLIFKISLFKYFRQFSLNMENNILSLFF